MSDIFAVANFMSTLSRLQRLLELQDRLITKQGERSIKKGDRVYVTKVEAG